MRIMNRIHSASLARWRIESMLQKIIAVDFDGTLCEDDRWPEIGKANRGVIDALL